MSAYVGSSTFYQTFVLQSPLYRAAKYLKGPQSVLAISGTDSRNIVILKSLVYKPAMVGVFGLATVEAVAKSAIAIVSFAFSLLTFFIKPFSNYFYTFSYDLMYNNFSFNAIQRAFSGVFFD